MMITIINTWGQYCVIVCVSIFLTPLFCSLSAQSLIYTPISLLFTPNYSTTIFHRVVSRAWCANEGGVGWGGDA